MLLVRLHFSLCPYLCFPLIIPHSHSHSHSPPLSITLAGTTSKATTVTSFGGLKKKKSYSNHGKKRHKYGGPNEASMASSDPTSLAANSVSNALGKIVSGVDLDIKVTLNKGIHYQVGSQGFPLQRKGHKSFFQVCITLSLCIFFCMLLCVFLSHSLTPSNPQFPNPLTTITTTNDTNQII